MNYEDNTVDEEVVDGQQEADVAADDMKEVQSGDTPGGEDNAAEEKKSSKKSFFAGKQSSSEVKKLKDENEALKKAGDELKESYMRMAAEYENYKRRTAKEMEMRYTDAKADTIKKLLPVVDSYERALQIEIPAECTAYAEGIKMIYDKLIETLSSMGVEEIKAKGEIFDPNYHYAVMHADDDSVGENVIVEVFEKGYKIGDKVLRYSMVKVAN